MTDTQEKVITRFPPSPTGELHIGRARTALFNYLFTKKHAGTMMFRFEDTDKERSNKEYEEDIIQSLEWLGIMYDSGPTHQSERTDIYIQHLNILIENGSAYVAEKSEKGEGNVIRFKNPNTTIVFDDLVRGEITFNTEDLGDFIIARSTTEPIYHLTVVVDDMLMNVTHVIRGEDGISNTPRQILIMEALGGSRPKYAHIPLILAPDKSKLSGRHGAVSVRQYKEMGILPEALINYLALLGWNPGTDQEIFTLQELIEQFDLSKVQKGGAIFSQDKLNWINKEHIMRMSPAELSQAIQSFLPEEITKLTQFSHERLEKLAPILVERIQTFKEVVSMADAGELEYFFETPQYHIEKIVWKDESIIAAATHLTYVHEILDKLGTNPTVEEVRNSLWPYAEEHGKGSVLWPMRYALSGQERSPDPFELVHILGSEEARNRIAHAIEVIKNT